MTEIIEKEEQIAESIKPYTFRKLTATDVSPMCKVIRKFGITEFVKCFKNEEIQKVISEEKKNKTKNLEDIVGIQVFTEIVDIVISHIPDCENELFEFFASVTGLKVKEIQSFSIITYAEMIIDFIKKEELADFFKVVLQLFN